MSTKTINPAKEKETARLPARQRSASRRPPSHKGVVWTLIHFFGSLKLAMGLFLVIIIASVVGTLYESSFDARVARYYIYEAPWFTLWLVVLCLNLAGAAFTRLPWKKRHTGFLLTHLGIIILLVGAMIGRHWGMEGSITLNVGDGSKNRVIMQNMVLNFWEEETGQLLRTNFPVDLSPPTENRPRLYPLPAVSSRHAASPLHRAFQWIFRLPPVEPSLVVDNYSENLAEENRLVSDPGSFNPGVKLSLSSRMMEQTQPDITLVQHPASQSFHSMAGLAQISLVHELQEAEGALLQIRPLEDGRAEYAVNNARGERKEDVLAVGESLETGWADWVVTLEKSFLEAEFHRDIYPDPMLEAASDQARGMTGVRGWLDLGDGRKGEPQWLLAGETHTLQIDEVEVVFAFGFQTERLPFSVELIDFDVPRDEGTNNPAAFTSTLRFSDPETGETLVSTCGMNRPAIFPSAAHRLFTGQTFKFSQASWNPEDLSESTVQVLFDPGWPFKWSGSLILLSGIFTIFYLRPYRNRRPEDRVDDELKAKKK